MNKKIIDATKDFAFIIIFTFIIATTLNYINPDISFNKFWSKLGNLGWINIYDSQNLNGLIVLGFILGCISFIYDIFFRKEKTSNSD